MASKSWWFIFCWPVLVYFIFTILQSNSKGIDKNSEKKNRQLNETQIQFLIQKSKTLYQFNLKRIQQISKKLVLENKHNQFSEANSQIFNKNTTSGITEVKINEDRSYNSLLQRLQKGTYKYCADMFQRNIDMPWDSEQKKKQDRFNELFKQVQRETVTTQKRLEGHSGRFKDQPRLYYELMQYDFVHNICETGFNAGHSTFVWLNSNPKVQVFSFDLGSHSYTKPMAKHLHQMFPGRLNITFGDSRKTLPQFRKNHPEIKCDLVIIDGGHFDDVPLLDFENFYNMVNVGFNHLVVLDDWPNSLNFGVDVGSMWIYATENQKAITIRQCMNINSNKGVTIGLFKEEKN